VVWCACLLGLVKRHLVLDALQLLLLAQPSLPLEPPRLFLAALRLLFRLDARRFALQKKFGRRRIQKGAGKWKLSVQRNK
jgi:hypothetical protein